MTDMTRRTVGRRRAVGRRRVVDTDSASAADSIFAATARLLARQSFAEISVARILHRGQSVQGNLLLLFRLEVFRAQWPARARHGRHLRDGATVPGPIRRGFADGCPAAQHPGCHAGLASSPPIVRGPSGPQAWHSEPELRDLWLAIAERFIAAGAVEIERERAAGVSQLASAQQDARRNPVLGHRTGALHRWAEGCQPTLADEEAAVDALVSMWRGTLYAP